MDRELPDDIFLGEPRADPAPLRRRSPRSATTLADALADEKANEEIQDTFDTIRDEVDRQVRRQVPRVDDDIAEARKEGRGDRRARPAQARGPRRASPRSTSSDPRDHPAARPPRGRALRPDLRRPVRLTGPVGRRQGFAAVAFDAKTDALRAGSS